MNAIFSKRSSFTKKELEFIDNNQALIESNDYFAIMKKVLEYFGFYSQSSSKLQLLFVFTIFDEKDLNVMVKRTRLKDDWQANYQVDIDVDINKDKYNLFCYCPTSLPSEVEFNFIHMALFYVGSDFIDMIANIVHRLFKNIVIEPIEKTTFTQAELEFIDENSDLIESIRDDESKFYDFVKALKKSKCCGDKSFYKLQFIVHHIVFGVNNMQLEIKKTIRNKTEREKINKIRDYDIKLKSKEFSNIELLPQHNDFSCSESLLEGGLKNCFKNKLGENLCKKIDIEKIIKQLLRNAIYS